MDNLTWTIPAVENLMLLISQHAERGRMSDIADKVASNVLHWLEHDGLLDEIYTLHKDIECIVQDNVGDWIIAGLEGKI